MQRYSACRLCPRQCGINRQLHKGRCGVTAALTVARAALHHWEEPCISGTNGSGTVFFSGCPLGCIYCQNAEIRGGAGKQIGVRRLTEIFLELQAQGAHNINLVTPTHYTPHIITALTQAKKQGLRLPVVYNCSGYESLSALRSLDGLVDIYLPDFKYSSASAAAAYSDAPDYAAAAKRAIAEMVRQTGACCFDGSGLLQRGTLVRHLLLPGHLEEAKAIVRYVFKTYGNSVYISLMQQYTPMPQAVKHPELSRRVTPEEYDALVGYAVGLGVENGFIQEREAATESFIPPFNCEGV